MRGLIDDWLKYVDKNRIQNEIGKRNVYIWGAYFNGKTVLQWLEDLGINVTGFIDGHKKSNVYAEKKIFHPNEVLGEKKCYIIIAVVGIRAEIMDYIIQNNLKNHEDYLYISEEIPEVSIYAVKEKYRDCNGNEIVYEGGGVLQCHVCFKGYNNKLTVGVGFEPNDDFKLTIENGGKAIIGNYFKTEGRVNIDVETRGSLLIGNNCYIMRESRVSIKGGSFAIGNYMTAGERFLGMCSENSPVTIGSDCMFSHDVSILATNGHSIFDLVEKENVSSKKERYVKIGDHVWLGKSVIVLYNSRIKQGCIVGAGSIVKGDFGSNSVLAGNPAKVVTNNCTWDRRRGIEFGEI